MTSLVGYVRSFLLRCHRIRLFHAKTLLEEINDPEIARTCGNKWFKKDLYTQALKFYDRALELDPKNAAHHSNRGAALSRLGKIWEGVKECEKAINLDPKFALAHQNLALMLLRLGQVDNARKCYVKERSDAKFLAMIKEVDTHWEKCAYARRRDEWNDVLREAGAAMVSGADLSPQLAMCKVEALVKLQRLNEAQKELEHVPEVEPFPASFSQTRIFDMISEAYTYFVKSHIYFALERFDDAAKAIAKASEFDPQNIEVKIYKKIVKLIQRALSNSKLEKWAEGVRDYESLSQALPYDKYIAKSLFQAQVALRFSHDDSLT
ncbi:unnamed protein product [Arabis nemorensis]|uniref:Uncharacterized protein n=1 Tax=Arabis nemorensis TaxID=586526 RepID=A0A565BFW7_9BRAS|nr:unnamed protein product [Arabis nemorensis]